MNMSKTNALLLVGSAAVPIVLGTYMHNEQIHANPGERIPFSRKTVNRVALATTAFSGLYYALTGSKAAGAVAIGAGAAWGYNILSEHYA